MWQAIADPISNICEMYISGISSQSDTCIVICSFLTDEDFCMPDNTITNHESVSKFIDLLLNSRFRHTEIVDWLGGVQYTNSMILAISDAHVKDIG